MSFNIEYSHHFKKSAKTLSKKYPSFKNDLHKLIDDLAENPTLGTSLGNNLFKVRMSIQSKGRGKSGGARVITCVLYKDEKILLADIYDKGDYSTVDEKQIIKILTSEGFNL
jgi:mRNA-degrading endonuclease RelE of RelBE toxin-antitoxin system